MELPACIYGYYRNVKKECNKFIRKIIKGDNLAEAIGDKMIDTSSAPGFIVLEGPHSILGGHPHYNLFALLYIYMQLEKNEEKRDKFFFDALQNPWSTLLLLTGNVGLGQLLHIPEKRHKPFLNAVVKFYDTFNAEGSKYSNGGQEGRLLWDCGTNIKFVMARMNVPQDVLRAPLPIGGIKELITRYKLLDDN